MGVAQTFPPLFIPLKKKNQLRHKMIIGHVLSVAAEQKWLLNEYMKKGTGRSYWMRCIVGEQKPHYWPVPTLSGANTTALTVRM